MRVRVRVRVRMRARVRAKVRVRVCVRDIGTAIHWADYQHHQFLSGEG